MNITRLTELTLIYMIQDKLSQFRGREKPKSADYKTYNLKYNNIQTKYPVVVYANGIEYNITGYKVDYINGMIIFNTPLTSSDIIEVDYTCCPVNIYDESINPQDSNFRFPAVAVYEIDRDDRAYELGNTKKELHPIWGIDVYAERGGERNDITDDIMKMFEEGTFRVIDYNISFPINSDGTANSNFNETSQIAGYMYCDSINYRKGGSLDIGDRKRYITEITVDLTINI